MPNLGMPELLVILVIVVLLFGTRKLPELGKGVGSAIRNFKSAMRDSDKEEIEPPRPTQQIAEGSDKPAAQSSQTSFGKNV
ncbi:MAG TPA: twin-arginine translocase TatA/TatE family subunit [Blastocatellia bacterium]|nr:twin-arginine translocase TatA/TatE family subunit [Blastocatellia bacterium]